MKEVSSPFSRKGEREIRKWAKWREKQLYRYMPKQQKGVHGGRETGGAGEND